jgi:hypothetical protein
MHLEAGPEDFTAQGPFHELHSPFCGRQAEAFGTIGLKRGVHRMRRGMLGELGADSAVPVTRSLDAAADEMARDGREDDGVPAHCAVP